MVYLFWKQDSLGKKSNFSIPKGEKKNYLLSVVLDSAKLKLLVLSSGWKIFALEESLTYMFVPARSQEMKLSDFQLNNTLSQLSDQNVADIIEGAW